MVGGCATTPAGEPTTEPQLASTKDAAAARRLDPVTVTVDASEAPELEAWGERAKAICEAQYPILCEMLDSEGFVPAANVAIVFKKEMHAPAATGGDVIHVSARHVSRHPDDFGMMVHELVHVVQAYPPSKADMGWLTEGIADYIRYYVYEPGSDRSRIDTTKASYRDGYRTTAAFLNFLIQTRDREIIQKLNSRMRRGECDDSSFKALLGEGLEDLWDDFIAREKVRQAAAP
jgi:hypothetical protein